MQIRSLMIAISILLQFVASSSNAGIMVSTGFTVTQRDLGTVLGGITLSAGGAYGSNLYVGGSGTIFRVDPSLASSSTFATGVGAGGLRPDGLRFAPSTYGATAGQLFLTRDDGSVLVVSASGAVSTFSSGGTLFSSNDLEFAKPGSPFGASLFVSNGPFGFGNISRVDVAGVNSVFAMQSKFSNVPIGLGFATAGSLFGGDLYSGLADGAIVRISSTGNVSSFTKIDGLPDGLAFSPGGTFGDALYVSDLRRKRILKVDSSGNVNEFATGFSFGDGIDTKLVFSSDGNALFITNGTEVVKISASTVPEPSSLVLFAALLTFTVTLRHRSFPVKQKT